MGFVSPDFRSHPVGHALINVIEHLKSYNFNLFGYYNFSFEDDLTNKFKKDFDYFHNITDLSDEQTINKIRSDGIHILIDLAGYTFNNRLSIFCNNPHFPHIMRFRNITNSIIKKHLFFGAELFPSLFFIGETAISSTCQSSWSCTFCNKIILPINFIILYI